MNLDVMTRDDQFWMRHTEKYGPRKGKGKGKDDDKGKGEDDNDDEAAKGSSEEDATTKIWKYKCIPGTP